MAGKMNGIDISKWQGKNGFNVKNVEADFVIVRATYGTKIVDQYFKTFANATLSMNRLLGLYHFATGSPDPISEAKYFLAQVKPYVGRALLILDWESETLSKGPGYAKEFCDYVYQETGVIPILYTNTYVPGAFNWNEFLAAGYKYLWGAEYNKNKEVHGYTLNPANKHLPTKGFTEIIRQYSSNTYLEGYTGRLDVNEAYIDRATWMKLCKKTAVPQEEKLTDEQVAQKIINREDGWGVKGEARVAKLKAEGYDPKVVQAYINKILHYGEYYTVLAGDTLSEIARDHGLTLQQILELNPDIKNPRIIKVGEQIRFK